MSWFCLGQWIFSGSWEGTQPGPLGWPRLTGFVCACVLFNTMWCHIQYKTGGDGQGRRIASWEWAGHCIPDGGKITLCITCFVYSFISIIVIFSLHLLLLNYLYLTPRVLPFFFWFSSLSHQGRKEWANGHMVLCCQLGLNNEILDVICHWFWKNILIEIVQ